MRPPPGRAAERAPGRRPAGPFRPAARRRSAELGWTAEWSPGEGAGTVDDGRREGSAQGGGNRVEQVTVGELRPHDGPVVVADYDPEWPRLFEREAERIRGALGGRALMVEHVGSTSVPGLAAKPVIDVLLAVADSADEPAYLPE